MINCFIRLLVFLYIGLLICMENVITESITDIEKLELKEKVLEMFDHAYGAYKKYAHPADELMPLSCRGRYRGSEADRGDIDEALGNFSLTLIDALDTLVVLGYVDEFEEQVRFVIKNVNFNSDVVVSVFETNIRVLGGLLGAHSMAITLRKKGKHMKWYNDELLNKATDVADRLLAAFNTSTGIPYPKVNLRYGINHSKSRVGHESHTCTACAGTMIMEFGALSRLTGKPIYEEKAHKAMEALWRYRSRHSDLVGTTINIHNGDWTRRDSGVGAGIDSYYEYCLKAYILLGDEEYRDKFNKHYAAIKKYIHQGYMLLDVFMHQPHRPARSFVDALQAFWPGLQVLKGDLKPAIETHEMLYNVAKKFKFLPEAFTTNFDVYWAQHPLRPEFIESTYFLYQATKDPYYLSVGKHVINTLEKYARVKCGFAAFQDLRTLAHEDKMDSFVLAETFKYLYLLFSEESEHVINTHDFIFTTEAHLLPLYLSVTPASKPKRTNTTKEKEATHTTITVEIEEDDHSKSCPNPKAHTNLRRFAEMIRKKVNAGQKNSLPSCNKPGQQGNKQNAFITETFMNQIKAKNKDRPRRLLASAFSVTNREHLNILKDFGISIEKEDNGKIQLQHQSVNAKDGENAEEGVLFMQEMIQLAKERGEAEGMIKPRKVFVMSPPHNGKVQFQGGYAQFGPDLEKMLVQSEAVESIPYRACQNIQNSHELIGRIAVVERGDCMFIDKVRLLQSIGAKAAIIIDHQEGTSDKLTAPFGMSGDGREQDVRIPSLFLFHVEGQQLRKYMDDHKEQTGDNLVVKLSSEATVEETPVTTPPPPLTPKSKIFPETEQVVNHEELAKIPDEYFVATKTEVHSKTMKSIIMEYVGPNKKGVLKKFIRSKLETCEDQTCTKKKTTTFTDEIEYLDRPNQRHLYDPNVKRKHYFQTSKGISTEFSSGTNTASVGDNKESTTSDSYIEDVVSENVKSKKEDLSLTGQKKKAESATSESEGIICTENGCYDSFKELKEMTDHSDAFLEDLKKLQKKLSQQTEHDLKITQILIDKNDKLKRGVGQESTVDIKANDQQNTDQNMVRGTENQASDLSDENSNTQSNHRTKSEL